ncbi:hypothetical protein R1sor_026404 [Riccia sorocarpa]|uniref:Uncharacterized protein n=1 Tax=Riccia sorocarpa TaxID=122646 RepID=A0ABD3GCY2_9MARC
MLVECFKLQPRYDPDKVYAEEENFLKHVEEYRAKFWTEVWNSTERNLLNDGRRAKRLFFRYAVWIRRFDIYPACFALWRLPPSDLFSMFSNDDRLSHKWEEIAEWERENCPFYVDYIINPPVPFDEWEELCYQRRIDAARTQFAIEENASHPELLPDLIEAHRLTVEKLPQVFDPTKLQKLSPEETVEQAKKFEPKVEQVLQVFTKLKRKKPVVEEKTPAKSTAEPSKQTSEEPPEQSSRAAPRSGRKQGKKKTAPVEDNVPPPTADLPLAPANPPPVEATVLNEEPAVTVAVPSRVPAVVLTTAAADIGTEEVDQTHVERQAKRLKRKAETKDFSNGEIRPDLQFQMEKKWVAVTSNLVGVISALKQKRQQGRVSDPILAIEEIAKICGRLRTAGRRVKPFSITGKRTDQGSDLIMIDIPTGRSIEPEQDVPNWNVFPLNENYPRLVLNLANRLLDDNGHVIILHSGSLESCQQIADTMEVLSGDWRHYLSYDIVNERGTYVPNSKILVSS